jgi:hypothetical protein
MLAASPIAASLTDLSTPKVPLKGKAPPISQQFSPLHWIAADIFRRGNVIAGSVSNRRNSRWAVIRVSFQLGRMTTFGLKLPLNVIRRLCESCTCDNKIHMHMRSIT